ncbi:prenyltransferase [Lapillicoccus jejuensis]|uniref:Prenyltransferase/squalene oxidase-like repeat protein n=1 Tax=Lapillicoccus jejuensis TaxID=402171 RepID=A0A542DVF6_9MICO|nr:prenyltransferase [Lapillicoccus jejuensis]TQJ07067.1 hypothetical protein FB458_0114 [Lapillicoccus jejuensis]
MRPLEVPGVLTAAQTARTADAIARAQTPGGAIPWYPGGRLDPWDHVQAAMGLTAAGRRDEAAAALRWSAGAQRRDGTWPMAYGGPDATTVLDPHADLGFGAYLATGVRHHHLATGDRRLVDETWPAVRAALDLVVAHQRDDGTVPWAVGAGGPVDDALLTASASTALSLRHSATLGELVRDPHPGWLRAARRLAHAVADHPEAFSPKPTHAMDWYYPVLTGALTGARAAAHLDARWAEFVEPGLGVRCVSDHPWVTGGESAELALALDAAGRPARAAAVLRDLQHLRDEDGSYWTGLVHADGKRWPVERTTWTAATVLLAADALAGATAAGGLFRDAAREAHHAAPYRSEKETPCRCRLAS